MASSPNGELGDSHPKSNHIDDAASVTALAQAFKDLARGEKTAQALESNLSSLEKRIDELLASFEAAEQQAADNQPPLDGEPAKSVDEKEEAKSVDEKENSKS